MGRFTDWDLRVRRKDDTVYSFVPGPANPFTHDPSHLYRVYQEK